MGRAAAPELLWEAGCLQPAEDKHCEVPWVGDGSCAVIQTCPDLTLNVAALQAALTDSCAFPLFPGTHSGSIAARTPKPKWGNPLPMGCPASTVASCS